MFFPYGRIIARGLQDQRYDKLWGKAKMETGVNPVRSRHCKERVLPETTEDEKLWEGGSAQKSKSGNMHKF